MTQEEKMAIPEERPGAAERYDMHILLSLRRIIRAVDIHSYKLRTKYHITAPQLICLLNIADHGPMSSSALSRNVHISQSTLVGILDRLEQKELITKQRNTRDRRQLQLIVTDKGRELAARAPSPLQEELAQALRKLPKLEQASIALSLDRIVELMEAHHIEVSPVLDTATYNDAE